MLVADVSRQHIETISMDKAVKKGILLVLLDP
jgi:hypothetical protein